MPYDLTLYQGAAPYYLTGRPAYSRDWVATLAAELGLDSTGRFLDVGCGPGVLTVPLAPYFQEAIGIDPDAEMLHEAELLAGRQGVPGIRWIRALAEDIETLNLDPLRLVAFGQSFHWTDRERVAAMVYANLEPGGTLALITHAHSDRPQPEGPGYPLIPHEAIRAIIERYLGTERRAGQGTIPSLPEQHEDILRSAGFQNLRRVYCSGQDSLVQDVNGVLANYFSTSFAAPHLFGERRAQFEADVRAELATHSATGFFWDWPGDTQLLLAKERLATSLCYRERRTISRLIIGYLLEVSGIGESSLAFIRNSPLLE
ncbi:MAG: class I SAM-dependent methyltransferase [Armatimonas sp.]